MCYSVVSSARTTALSLAAIVYLLVSGDPYFKWLAITLIGWCLMQFAEMLLWLTDPRTGCTDTNKLITMTLIPFVLALQPLGSLFGSLYVIPWSKSSEFRKQFLMFYPVLIVAIVAFCYYYDPYKICTTVTKGGHLLWSTANPDVPDTISDKIAYFAWGFLIILPLLFWDKSFIIIACLSLIPLFGFSYGLLNTDSRASIWCYYTSYTSVIAAGFLMAKQFGFDVLRL
jgi:hypothetical protein